MNLDSTTIQKKSYNFRKSDTLSSKSPGVVGRARREAELSNPATVAQVFKDPEKEAQNPFKEAAKEIPSQRTSSSISQITKRKFEFTDTEQASKKVPRSAVADPDGSSEDQPLTSRTNGAVSDESTKRQGFDRCVAGPGTGPAAASVKSSRLGASSATTLRRPSYSVLNGVRPNCADWNHIAPQDVSQGLGNQKDCASLNNAVKPGPGAQLDAENESSAPVYSPSPALYDFGFSLDDGQTPTTRRVRTNTDVDTVRSLEANEWVSTTAIEKLLGILPKGNAKIYDASFMEADDPHKMLRKGSVKYWSKGVSVFPTNHDGKHWTLVVTDPEAFVIEFYDSQGDPEYEEAARAAATCWTTRISQLRESKVEHKKWSFEVKQCPRQNNTSDCGISTIVCAIRRILNLPIPSEFDFSTWRRVLHTVLLKSLLGHYDQPPAAVAVTLPKSSQSIDQDKMKLGDSSSLLHKCDSFNYAHRLAQKLRSQAIEVQDTIDALLNKLQMEVEAAMKQHNEDNLSVVNHREMITKYKSFVIHHAPGIRGLEESLQIEEKKWADSKLPIQRLQQQEACWEAGREVSRAERERQELEVKSVQAAMKGFIERFDIHHQRLLEAIEENRRSKLDCMERLDAFQEASCSIQPARVEKM
ncbi:MAG: hypothetical protein Q9216_005443 [Gyalolechia sp. 2 TL-2023]